MDGKQKDEVLFINWLMMFHSLAWQQLGKVKDPASGKVERNLEAARVLIDTVEMIGRKTEGRRSENEERIMKEILKELKLNYVDEARKTDAVAPPEKGDGSGEEQEKPGGESA